jgi:hypothetical protein
LGIALALAGLLACAAPAALAQEIPAGTRFAVELRDKLEAKHVKRGKEFNARTLEALHASDGSVIPAGAKVRGRVAYAKDNELVLDFFRIETRRGKLPISATVVSVPGEKDVKRKAGKEGEIKSEGGRGKSAGIGALVGAGVGAAVGASQGGGKGAAIGAGAGAAGGALIGAAAGGKDLVLRKGTELELELDRPLYYARR